MLDTWGVFIVSAAALGLWVAIAARVRDERAPYIWLLVLASVSLTVASLATYAQAIPQDWARFTALVQRAVFLIAGAYTLYRMTRHG